MKLPLEAETDLGIEPMTMSTGSGKMYPKTTTINSPTEPGLIEEQARIGWLLTLISEGPTEAAKSSPGTFLGSSEVRCSEVGNFRGDLRELSSRSQPRSAAAEAEIPGPGSKSKITVKNQVDQHLSKV